MNTSLCRTLGPGRLPYASRRDVGGGIAMAATGLLGAIVWFGGAFLLLYTGVADTISSNPEADFGFLIVAGLFFLPLSIPAAFVVGLLSWRYLYPSERQELGGALLGAGTATVSLAVGAVSLSTILAISNVTNGTMGIGEAIIFGVLLLPISIIAAIIAAGWLLIPLGTFGGWYHEHSKYRSTRTE